MKGPRLNPSCVFLLQHEPLAGIYKFHFILAKRQSFKYRSGLIHRQWLVFEYRACPPSICCELTLTHYVTQEGAPIIAGKHSSQVHICAIEYQQLFKTCTYTNLSWINTLNRTYVLFSLRQHTTQMLSWHCLAEEMLNGKGLG